MELNTVALGLRMFVLADAQLKSCFMFCTQRVLQLQEARVEQPYEADVRTSAVLRSPPPPPVDGILASVDNSRYFFD